MARKTAQEIANENLETAERVKERADARLEKATAAHEKAKEDAKMADRRLRAARMVALDEETDSIDAEPTAADDVL